MERWDIVTLGNLSRNRYWGESQDRAVRAPLCTSTLIQGEGFRLLVDPAGAYFDGMAPRIWVTGRPQESRPRRRPGSEGDGRCNA